MKEKIQEIEILRGLSFIAVVIQHVLGYINLLPSLSYHNVLFLTFTLTINRFAIPTFIFITGFVLFYNHYHHLDIAKYTVKRLKDTLIPYLCWTLIFTVSSAVTINKALNLHDFVEITGINLLKGTAMYHLWYIVMILQMYFMFPLIRKVFILMKNKVIYLVVAVALLDILISYTAGHLIPLHLKNNNPNWITAFFTDYRHIIFISWLFYFCLGGYIALNYQNFKHWLTDNKGNCFIFFGLSALYIGIKTSSSATLSQHGYTVNFNVSAPLNLNMYIYSFFAIMFFYFLSLYLMKNKARISRFLSNASNYTYEAYLIHPFFISLICKSTSNWNLNIYVQFISDVILCCSLSLTASYIMGRMPFINTILVGSKGFTKSVKSSYIFQHRQF